jgi:hypothetical protein
MEVRERQAGGAIHYKLYTTEPTSVQLMQQLLQLQTVLKVLVLLQQQL